MASSGMNSMNRTSTPRWRPNVARSTISSSLTPRCTTVLSLTGCRPASIAASMPSSTLASSSRRVISTNRSRWSVSRLMLIRRSPAWRNGSASWRSVAPLVVIATSTPRAARRSTSRGRRWRTVGSPPVSRIESTPVALDHQPGQALDLLERQHLAARQPDHALLGHAVGAAEVAAVGDRDPQVLDDPPEAIGELDAVKPTSAAGGRPRPSQLAHRRRRAARARASASAVAASWWLPWAPTGRTW